MRRQRLKEWTLLLYMSVPGPDEKKEKENDLEALRKVGSSQHVNVVVQCREPSTDEPAERYFVKWDGSLEPYEPVPESLANLGDPQALVTFVKWADYWFPSRKTFLIMWGHGYGVQSIFSYDWEDWLKIPELAWALRQIKEEREEKLDVLGFDACVMQGLEVAHELRDYARYTVGSPAGTPKNSWQYGEVLKKVKKSVKKGSHSGPKAVAGMVLDCLEKTVDCDDQTILSVLDLGKIDRLVGAIARLVDVLDIAYDSKEKKSEAARALRRAGWVDCRQLPDLGDVCEKLREGVGRIKVSPEVKRKLRYYLKRVLTLLEKRRGFVARTALTDKRLRTQTGVSICVPRIRAWGEEAANMNLDVDEDIYRLLDFSDATGWADWAYSLPRKREYIKKMKKTDPCRWFR